MCFMCLSQVAAWGAWQDALERHRQATAIASSSFLSCNATLNERLNEALAATGNTTLALTNHLQTFK